MTGPDDVVVISARMRAEDYAALFSWVGRQSSGYGLRRAVSWIALGAASLATVLVHPAAIIVVAAVLSAVVAGQPALAGKLHARRVGTPDEVITFTRHGITWSAGTSGYSVGWHQLTDVAVDEGHLLARQGHLSYVAPLAAATPDQIDRIRASMHRSRTSSTPTRARR